MLSLRTAMPSARGPSAAAAAWAGAHRRPVLTIVPAGVEMGRLVIRVVRGGAATCVGKGRGDGRAPSFVRGPFPYVFSPPRERLDSLRRPLHACVATPRLSLALASSSSYAMAGAAADSFAFPCLSLVRSLSSESDSDRGRRSGSDVSGRTSAGKMGCGGEEDNEFADDIDDGDDHEQDRDRLHDFLSLAARSRDGSVNSAGDGGGGSGRRFLASLKVPPRRKHKIVSASDAASLVSNGDTVCVSGFVSQGSPEAVLRALGERYESSGTPHSLTLLFGGGPGDWGSRGLNHLAKKGGSAPESKNIDEKSDSGKENGGGGDDGHKDTQFPHPMLRRTIGGHYGQVPLIESLALNDDVEAWALPLGSISRMIRSQAAHSPGFISKVGLGTFVDPDVSGGAQNEAAFQSPLHRALVSKITVQNQEYLLYKALPIHVAIVRATTADPLGNLSAERESLLCDQKIIAAAARNSGGIVIAQVERVAEVGSLPSRLVAVPGPLVDCVVVAGADTSTSGQVNGGGNGNSGGGGGGGGGMADDHWMSYESEYDPSFTGEIRAMANELMRMPLDERKVVARRACFGLRPGTVVNLGIGLPEGLASVAAEEGLLDYITLTTEPGVFGGIPASGRNFGPSANADALMEMNQMFDYYDGGGLDICFLGAAQISKEGDVNVSRMSKGRITGPGGFIDISQNTVNVCFMSTFTAKGLEVGVDGGKVSVRSEGRIHKFVPSVMEKTFSGNEAVRRGQKVLYVTERAVFTRTADHDVLELIEIAPGVDLQKDVLDRMSFVPIISPNLRVMDSRIFGDGKMGVRSDMFGSLQERVTYHPEENALFLDLAGITIDVEDDIAWLIGGLERILKPLVTKFGSPHMIINYEGFDIHAGLEDRFSDAAGKLEKKYYRSVKRYYRKAFTKAKLGRSLRMMKWDPQRVFDEFDKNHDGIVSIQEFREGMSEHFGISVTPEDYGMIKSNEIDVDSFNKAVLACLRSGGKVMNSHDLIVDMAPASQVGRSDR